MPLLPDSLPGLRSREGKVIEMNDATHLLEAVVRPGDLVCLEGDNQKQADALSAALLAADPAKLHDLHMVQSGVVLPEHLDLFERGIARKARLRLFRTAVGAYRQHAVRRQDRARCGAHLPRTVCPLLHRSHAERGADCR